MKVIRDAALEDLVNERLDEDRRLRGVFKRLAHRYVSTPTEVGVLRGMELAADLSSDDGIVLSAVRVHKGVLVFKGTPSEAAALVRDAAVAPRKAAPEKVAVKMVLGRIGKVAAAVARVNAQQHEQREARRLRPQDFAGAGWAPVHDDLPVARELASKQALREYLSRLALLNNGGSTGSMNWTVREAVRNAEAVLERQEVTDAVVAEAWNRFVVREVLES